MEEIIRILSEGSKFFDGSDLIWFYFVYSLAHNILRPLREKGNKIEHALDSLSHYLDEHAENDKGIRAELGRIAEYFESLDR